jgi:tetratricopeptide (TPR) repeat protein
LPIFPSRLSLIFISFLFLTLFFFYSPPPLFSEETGQDQVHFKKGSEYLISGKIDLAEKEFLSALSLNPSLHRAHFGLGLVYLQKNNPEKAEKSFKEAIALQAEYAPAYRGLGQAAELKNDLAQAVVNYQKAVSLEKVNPAFANDVAMARSRLSQIGETPETALRANDHARRGEALLREKKEKEALDEFLLVLKEVPQNLKALENSAVILATLGRMEESAEQLKKIIAVNPGILFAHYLLGTTYEALEKTGEAWEEYNTVAALGEKTPQMREVAKAKEKIGQLGPSRTESIELARKIKEAISLFEQKRVDEAEKEIQEVLRKVPENIRAKYGLGLINLARDKVEEGQKILLEVVAKDPEMLSGHFYLGKAYLRQREIQKAFEEYKKVLELGMKGSNAKDYQTQIEEAKKDMAQFGNDLPRGIEAARLLKEGAELAKKEDFDGAKERFNSVLALVPRNLEALENLGLIYLRASSYEPQKAREFFEKMLSVDPGLASPRFRLAMMFENQGEMEKAMAMYREIIAMDGKEGRLGKQSIKRLHQMGETAEKARTLSRLLKEGEKEAAEKKWDDAAETYQKVLDIVPDRIEAAYALGVIHLQRKELDKAEKDFRNVTGADPENLEARLQLGLLLGGKGEYLEGVRELEQVISSGKEGKTVQIARNELEEMRKKGGSEDHFNKGVEGLKRIEEIGGKGPLKPGDPLAEEKKGLIEKSIREFNEAIKLNQDNPYYYFNLGLVYVHQFDLLSADFMFRKAIEKKPDLMPAHYQLAVMYEVAGAVEGALAEYEKVIGYGKEEDKEVQEARSKIEGLKGKMSFMEEAKGYALVANYLFLFLKETQKAGPLFLKAAELDPGNGEYWYDLGIYYEALFDREKAEGAYRKAIKATPNFSKPYFYLGIILEKKGEMKEAYENFLKAKKFEVKKESREAHLTDERIRFYEEKIKGSFSAAPFLYDNNPGNSEEKVSDYSAAGVYSLNLKYYHYKSLKALVSSSLNISSSVYYYSQMQYNNDSVSLEGYWPDAGGIEASASSSLGISNGYGGMIGWNSSSSADFKAKMIGFDTLNTHIGYAYSISLLNPFFDSTRLSLSWTFGKEHLGPGSLFAAFGVNNMEVMAKDDSNLAWTAGLTYRQPIAGYLSGSLGMVYGEADFKNADSGAQAAGLGEFFRKNRSYNLSAAFSYQLYRDLSLSIRGGWERVDSNFPALVARDIRDVLSEQTAPIGSYSKLTLGVTMAYSF